MRTRASKSGTDENVEENPVLWSSASKDGPSAERLAKELKKKQNQLEQVEASSAKLQAQLKELNKECDSLKREAGEAMQAKLKAEDQMALLQRGALAKQDSVATLTGQIEKLKEARLEEESLRRTAEGEANKLRQQLEAKTQLETQMTREMATIKDSLISTQSALEKEKNERKTAADEAKAAELAAQRTIKEMQAEHEAKEAKWRRDTKEVNDEVMRLRAEAKASAKEMTDRVRAVQEEALSLHAQLDEKKSETKKLREKLDASTNYIEALKSKVGAKGGAVAAATPSKIAMQAIEAGADDTELQKCVKTLQSQCVSLQGINDALKRKESDMVAQIDQMEKALRDGTTARADLDMKLEKSRAECKALTLSVDQLKQMQRVWENRVSKAEAELESFKTSQSALVEGAIGSENVMAAECKKLRSEIDRITNTYEATMKKLTLDLEETKEERDGALDMLATQSLDSETDVEKAMQPLRTENAAMKQAISALERKLADSVARVKELEKSLAASRLSAGGAMERLADSPGVRKSIDNSSELAVAHEKLKLELRSTKETLENEVENMTILLEEEMMAHSTTQEQLREVQAKLDLQTQTVSVLKTKLEKLTGEADELMSHAKGATASEQATIQALRAEVAAQTETCNKLQQLVDAKDHKLESMRIKMDELTGAEAKALQRHADVRTRLDDLLTKERESERIIQALTDAKKKLEERLEEHRIEQASEAGTLSSKLAERTEKLHELERSLESTVAQLEKEQAMVISLQKRVSVLETELAVAHDAMKRAEQISKETIEELKLELAANVSALTAQRDGAVDEASKKIATLTSELEELRTQLKSTTDTSSAAHERLQNETASLASALQEAREQLNDRDAAVDAANVKRQQAEAAVMSATARADALEADVKNAREMLQAAMQEAELSRAMAAEAELALDSARDEAAKATRDVRDSMVEQIDTAKRNAEEWQLRARDAEARADQYLAQISANEAEWNRQRDALQTAVSSIDSKKLEVERDGETRLSDANRLVFELRSKLSDIEPKLAEEAARAASLERRLKDLQEEKAKQDFNYQLRIEDLEANLMEEKEELQQEMERIQREGELGLQELRERCRAAEDEAAEAKRRAQDEAGNVEMVSNHSQEALNEMTRKYDDLKMELDQKTAQLERELEAKTSMMTEMDAMSASLSHLSAQVKDAQSMAEEHAAEAVAAKDQVRTMESALESAQKALIKAEVLAKDSLNAKEDEFRAVKDDLEARLQMETELTTSLKMDLASVKAQAAKVDETKKVTETQSSQLQAELDGCKDRLRDLEVQLQTATADYSLLEKNGKIAEASAERAAKTLQEDITRLNNALDESNMRAQKLEADLHAAQSELGSAKESIKGLEALDKEKSEDCSLLVQQLAESELKCEEHETTLRRIRGERDELRVAKSDLEAKVARLEKETQRLSAQLSSELSSGQSKQSELEEKYQETRLTLEKTRDENAELSAQLRKLDASVKRLEASEQALEKDKNKLQERLTNEKNELVDQLQEAKLALDTLSAKALAEKEALELEIKDTGRALRDTKSSLDESSKNIALLEQTLAETKTELAEAKERLTELRSADQELTSARLRFDKQSKAAEKEIESLRERLGLLEQETNEEKGRASENLHRAERAEQEASLAQKERDRLRDEMKEVREAIASLEKSVADRTMELERAKKDLEEEKQDHARTQRGIVDQQKLIAGHAERNTKLSAFIEEQKEEKVRLQARIKELEQAGSNAMSALTYQKDLQRLKEERDSAKSLVAQKTADLNRMQQMLVSMEEKGRAASGSPGGSDSGEVEEIQEKYNSTIQLNKKLEKQLTSLEAKYNFLKKKMEKK